MNKDRRQRIALAIEKLDEIRCDIECIADEEQAAYDNLPESLQYSDKGEAMVENFSDLEIVHTYINDVVNLLKEIVEH